MWWSNAPWAPTGYGVQTAQVCRRLRDDGHDVAIASNYGQHGAVVDWEGIPVYPGGADRYGRDTLALVASAHRADLVVGLYDSWVMEDTGAGLPVAWWTPVDHLPVPPKVADWCRGRRTLAMSRFGQDALAQAGIESVHLPHGIEGMAPSPSGFRERHGIPDDALLVMVNAANQGADPSRKAWPEMLLALSRAMRRHPDVWCYLHADLTRPGGVDVPAIIDGLGMDVSRIRTCDQPGYRLGSHTRQVLAEACTAADVLLATSMGEGFGLPVAEAMTCGTPAIVTDFSAMPEVEGGTGWRVGWQPSWNQEQRSWRAVPSVDGIVRALDEARAERGTVAASERSRVSLEHASRYDADRVYAESWRPFLASLEG